jgi:hypothetical protein
MQKDPSACFLSLSLFLLDGAAQLYVLFASAFLFVRLWRFAFGKKDSLVRRNYAAAEHKNMRASVRYLL